MLFPAGEPEAASVLPAWAGALEAAGLRRDFAWKSWGTLNGAALFRPAQPEADSTLMEDYENALDALRLKLDRAEQSCRDYQKLTDHQRSELSAAHEHEQQLETALNSVTQSHCWKATWPVRYLLSKARALLTAPAPAGLAGPAAAGRLCRHRPPPGRPGLLQRAFPRQDLQG